MDTQELNRKIQNLEILGADVMSAPQRAALRDEAQQLLDSLSVGRSVKSWALGGAAAGAVLPIVGLLSGGAAGAVYGAYRAHRSDVTDARERLERLLRQL